MDEVIKMLKARRIYFNPMSDHMCYFGMDENFIVGTFSFYGSEPLCRFSYQDGDIKYFKNFKYNEEEFDEELEKAGKAYIHFKNAEVENILSVLD
jgi:hypothetical protein